MGIGIECYGFCCAACMAWYTLLFFSLSLVFAFELHGGSVMVLVHTQLTIIRE